MHAVVKALIEEQKKKDKEWDDQMRKDKERSEELRSRKATDLLPNLRVAQAHHYRKWLRGYIKQGGKPTHYYDYYMPDGRYIAKNDFTLLGLCGANADIIVPKGISVDIEALGLCNLYFMKDYTHKGDFVPIFANTIV